MRGCPICRRSRLNCRPIRSPTSRWPRAGDAANILLLDALNTQMTDQSFVHAQMIKYIKGVRPGTRLAIFALGSASALRSGIHRRSRSADGGGERREVGGQSAIVAAVADEHRSGRQRATGRPDGKKWRRRPDRRRFKRRPMHSVSFSKRMRHLRPTCAFTLRWKRCSNSPAICKRIPGRKNVIWFSGSFPISIFEDFTVGAGEADAAVSERNAEDGEFVGWLASCDLSHRRARPCRGPPVRLQWPAAAQDRRRECRTADDAVPGGRSAGGKPRA